MIKLPGHVKNGHYIQKIFNNNSRKSREEKIEMFLDISEIEENIIIIIKENSKN